MLRLRGLRRMGSCCKAPIALDVDMYVCGLLEMVAERLRKISIPVFSGIRDGSRSVLAVELHMGADA